MTAVSALIPASASDRARRSSVARYTWSRAAVRNGRRKISEASKVCLRTRPAEGDAGGVTGPVQILQPGLLVRFPDAGVQKTPVRLRMMQVWSPHSMPDLERSPSGSRRCNPWFMGFLR